MAVIDGETGSVTFASGYTTNAYAWTARPSTNILDITTFSPTGSYTMAAAGLKDWEGTYRCRKQATANTTLSAAGSAYDNNAFRFEVECTCNPLQTTTFSATYHSRIAGLLSARGSWTCYIDDTQALPEAGTSDTLTFTLDTGESYAIPLIVESVDVEVVADGSGRQLTCNFVNNGEITVSGGAPVAGETGSATFVAKTGREYSGNILITSVRIALDAAREEADFTFTWVGAGAATAA